ncbi:chemotaxis protein CheW [Rhodoblastus sphagnicola]|uniref:Chemotaxis protein CheW n=1 Tax=Rhodoblastus sphagnicola TaxID=333368 RepID=A0A2S6NCF0_9HYPH|nr:chemotaxis protein CheW [Rhodoblastus sphagnicola]MBB4196847.1 purine-binding chemotaxis protein CheW [Rhodoblastus sphagnicola]PPQ32300.1 chemotaxis protein CheW [Rhodoblastus sphagnicola]
MSTVAQTLETLRAEFGGGAEAAADDSRQFVIFHIGGERFAVALEDVQEIIRPPNVVHMPLCPASLEGLANLRGVVLPVVNLRRAFNFAEKPADDATRVVVLDYGRPVGLVVDRMANVVTIEKERIEPASAIRSALDAEVLDGLIRDADGRSVLMILDCQAIFRREFGGDGQFSEAGESAGRLAHEKTQEKTVEAVDEDQLVSFEVAGQEYAFPIERVQEIVQLPNAITEVPNAPHHVLGVITLRQRLLPLVSLRALFGLPAAELTETNKVVVVSLGDGPGVGVVMDSVKEVLRVSRAMVEPVPDLLCAGDRGEISAICRLNDGKRLVSILSAQAMFDETELRQITGDDEEHMAGAGESENRAATLDDDEQFVLFRLMGEEYGVPIDVVQEIVRVPSELTRIPNTPDFIEGVINLRGAVLPVIDQRKRFRLEALARNDRQRIMVFTIRGARTGFIVDHVSEVRRIPVGAIGPAPDLSGEQKAIIRRVANLDKEKRLILLLDVLQLLKAEESRDIGRAVEGGGDAVAA